MKMVIKTSLIKILGIGKELALMMASIVFLAGCKGCTSTSSYQKVKTAVEKETLPVNGYDTIVLVLGNPGAGKSSLCNFIFQKNIFKAGLGLHLGGLTKYSQGYVFKNILYIDTPGLADVNIKIEAAQAVEEVLKKNSDYKIIFVITLEGARISAEDIATINTICGSIHIPFEYGLVINKVTDRALQKVEKSMKVYLSFFNKQPSSTFIIKRDESIDDAEDRFITDLSTRKNLLNFINHLKATKMRAKDIQAMDVKSHIEKVNQLKEALYAALQEE